MTARPLTRRAFGVGGIAPLVLAGTLPGGCASDLASDSAASANRIVGGVVAGQPLPVAQPVSDFAGPGHLATIAAFPSALSAPRSVYVWLPPGLADSRRKAPLLVMHDGQNLFEARHGMGGQTWEMAEAAVRQPVPPVIIGLWNTPARRREYLPTDMERHLPQDIRDRLAGANGGPPLSDGYLAFLASELVPWARATLPVSHRREDTLVMGSSMGGLISLAAVCRYPQLFGGAGCLSTHWPLLTDSAAYQHGDLETPRVLAALDRFAATSLPRPGRHRLFFDRGSLNLDSFYPPYSTHMDRVFAGLGWREETGLKSLVIEGGDHNEASWRGRVDAALGWLMAARG
jgi:enterochelin esterase-like enzyme